MVAEQIKSKIGREDKRPFFTFLVFLVLSTVLWLLVKLSEDYTTQTTFCLKLDGIPADQWVASPEQTVKLSLTIDGFHILRYKAIREAKRFVTIDLDEVPYRPETGNTYSFSSQYVIEKIADRLDVNATNITMNEDKVYFEMNPLKSKVVPVTLRSDIRTQRQFEVYGLPILDPSSITIFGPKEIIDTMKSVKTELLSKINVSESIHTTVPLDLLNGLIQSNVKSVNAVVEVVKYTEADLKVPITAPDTLRMRFFPETLNLKCLVPIKDYSTLVPENFRVECDAEQLRALKPVLDVRLVAWPNNVKVLSVTPEKVEYLIIR